MKSQGQTKRKIGEKLEFNFFQVNNIISRHNKKKCKIETGIALKKKNILAKGYLVTEQDKIDELKIYPCSQRIKDKTARNRK